MFVFMLIIDTHIVKLNLRKKHLDIERVFIHDSWNNYGQFFGLADDEACR